MPAIQTSPIPLPLGLTDFTLTTFMVGLIEADLLTGEGPLAVIAVLTIAAFGGLLVERESSNEQLVAASIVHIVTTGGKLLVSYVLVVSGKRLGLSSNGAFLLVEFQIITLYNIFLLPNMLPYASLND